MSIVVVVKKAGKAVIAADTLYTFGSTKVSPSYIHKPNKIHQFKNSYIGVVGAAAHEPVFDHLIEHHHDKLSFNSKTEIFETYLKIHPLLKDKYFINDTEDDEDAYKSSQINGLICNEYGIFGMYSWREVYEFDRFWALGSGEDCALGAMFAAFDLLDEPEQIAELGVRAACEFDDGCGLPLTLHSVIIKDAPPPKAKRKGKGSKKS